MKFKLDSMSIPPSCWDGAVTAFGGGLLQSTIWAEAIVSLGGEPRFFVAGDIDQPLALMFSVFRQPVGSGLRLKQIIYFLRLIGLRIGTLEVSDGPLFADQNTASSVLPSLLNALESSASSLRAAKIRITYPHSVPVNEGDDVDSIFRNLNYRRTNWATFLVDLRPDDDAILKAVDHSVRKSIKKCQREGVTVKQISSVDEYLSDFLNPYLMWKGQKNSRLGAVEDAKKLWGCSSHRHHYNYYVAVSSDGIVIGVLGMYCFNGVATEIMSGLSPVAIERKLPVQDLIHWQMFIDAKHSGCHTFDLAGVSPVPESQKEDNIKKFKKKFGGKYVEYPVYEKDCSGAMSAKFLGFARKFLKN